MLYQQISQNKQRTVVLLVVFFALLALIGASAGYLLLDNYAMGLVLALVIGVIYATSMIFQSTSLVMSMNNAREVTEKRLQASSILSRIWLWWLRFRCREFLLLKILL